jgi:GDP-L-fucose synthase
MCDAYRAQYGCDYISVMPTNLYGYNDNYHPQNSHVLPALIRRFHEAKEQGTPSVTIWGSGSPLREFLFADDLAEACVYLMQNFSEAGFINIGSGKEITIKDLALLIKKIVGYEGELTFDATKPDGTPRKLMDVSKLATLGWTYKTELETGIKLAYEDFLVKHVER